MRDDDKLILEAYEKWRKENPEGDTEKAFLAGGRFVLDYLIEKQRI